MSRPVGVHISHCCKWHGCKYGDKDCPVVNGEVEQEYLCEDCYNELEEENYFRAILTRIVGIKKWQAKHKKEDT